MIYAFTAEQLRAFADQVDATKQAGEMGLIKEIEVTDPDNGNMRLGYITMDGDETWGFVTDY